MRAGQMTHKLRLLKPTYGASGFGEEETTYTETATVWAERAKLSGNRSNEVGEHFPAYSAVFNIRAAHEVGENWRAEEIGGHLYTVTNIEPNARRGYNALFCERVNE